MAMKMAGILFLGVALCGFALGQSVGHISIPSDADIRQILVNRIDVERQSVGIVVGIIDPGGRRTIAYGALEKGDQRSLTGNTMFEIGSVTKAFTSLLRCATVACTCGDRG
jgi:CubicO group peptidase (beta-lactamase class C family)